jgi:hypothetical protein
VGNLAVYTTTSAWAHWGGSHMRPEDWAQYPGCILSGIRGAVYGLWPEKPGEQYQDRDLERLRHDAGQLGIGFDTLVLRLGHDNGSPLPSPAEHIGRYRAKINHARKQGFYRLCAFLVNEPNLEVPMTPADFVGWYEEALRLFHAEFPDVGVISPAVAPYSGNDWEWWDRALRQCCAMSDFGGIHLYPTNEGELTGAWSLPWWQGQIPDKPLYVCEMGARTGTPANVRAALLPKLWAQVRDCPQVHFAAWFVQYSEDGPDGQHAQHYYTPGLLAQYVNTALGTAPVVPPVVPEPPVVPPVEPPTIPVGGRMRFMVTVERIE